MYEKYIELELLQISCFVLRAWRYVGLFQQYNVLGSVSLFGQVLGKCRFVMALCIFLVVLLFQINCVRNEETVQGKYDHYG